MYIKNYKGGKYNISHPIRFCNKPFTIHQVYCIIDSIANAFDNFLTITVFIYTLFFIKNVKTYWILGRKSCN